MLMWRLPLVYLLYFLSYQFNRDVADDGIPLILTVLVGALAFFYDMAEYGLHDRFLKQRQS